MKLVVILTLWLSSLALIAIATLSPFVFNFNVVNIQEAIDIALHNSTNPIDLLANIVLFLPLGFSSYALAIRHPKHRAFPDLIRVGLISIATSLLIEIAQLFIPGRFPTLSDIIFNGFGGFLGGLLALQLSSPKHKLASIKISKRFLVVAYLAYFSCIYLGLQGFTSQIKASDWQASYPLTIGNDAKGQSPWSGEASNIFMFDHALTIDSINNLLNSELDADSHQSLLFYCFADQGFNSQNNRLPPELDLCRRNQPKAIPSVEKESTGYLIQTEQFVFPTRLESNSAFTLALNLKSGYNPDFSVILSNGKNIYQTNFVLGIQKSRLFFRIRSQLSGASGMTPELVIPNFHQNFVNQNLVIVYDGISFRIYKDHINQFRKTSLLAGLYFFQPLSHFYQQWRLELLGFDLYKYLFIALTFLPAVFLVEFMITTDQVKSLREASLYVFSTSILALLMTNSYIGHLQSGLSESLEVLGVILLCWLGSKLYFIILQNYQL